MSTRLGGVLALGLLIGFGPVAPALAQSDPGGVAIISKLKPTGMAGSGSRGIGSNVILPQSANLAPAPVWPQAGRPIAWVAPRQQTEANRARETLAEALSITLQISFAPGSAALSPEAERTLAPLGEALNSSDLAPYRFRIEGHTDGLGDASVNMALSEQRAAAVRDYLSRAYRVDGRRLIAVGFGSSQPLVQTPPQVPEPRNRRVEVVNLGY